MEVSVESCVRGFHIYQDVWIPVVGEVLGCRREMTNTEFEDRYTVAVYKSEEVDITQWVPDATLTQYTAALLIAQKFSADNPRNHHF